MVELGGGVSEPCELCSIDEAWNLNSCCSRGIKSQINYGVRTEESHNYIGQLGESP